MDHLKLISQLTYLACTCIEILAILMNCVPLALYVSRSYSYLISKHHFSPKTIISIA